MTQIEKPRPSGLDALVRELDVLIRARYPLDFVHFVDDIFIMNREWFEEFAPRYRKEVGLPYVCNIRANYVTPEVAKLMKESNCHTAALGIEAGNDFLRNESAERGRNRSEYGEHGATLAIVDLDCQEPELWRRAARAHCQRAVPQALSTHGTAQSRGFPCAPRGSRDPSNPHGDERATVPPSRGLTV